MLTIGDFPFCPHGVCKPQIITDDVPGGFVVENGFATPQKFYSKSAHRKALADRGLRIGDKGEWRR
jgi:hypothetical protein